VDTSVLLDVLGGDPTHGRRSREALRAAYDGGALLACDVVWAEVRAHFPSDAAFDEALGTLGVTYDPLSALAAADAGVRWAAYRRGGGSRSRVVADFLVAAHALHQADRLLTRDRGFYRGSFRDLEVIEP
jgi:predicted nucleic acid-binding protein